MGSRHPLHGLRRPWFREAYGYHMCGALDANSAITTISYHPKSVIPAKAGIQRDDTNGAYGQKRHHHADARTCEGHLTGHFRGSVFRASMLITRSRNGSRI